MARSERKLGLMTHRATNVISTSMLQAIAGAGPVASNPDFSCRLNS